MGVVLSQSGIVDTVGSGVGVGTAVTVVVVVPVVVAVAVAFASVVLFPWVLAAGAF
jgi:hypothetical protein